VTLEAGLLRSDRSKHRDRPIDAVLMFKVLVVQTPVHADEQTEY
jgi:hypothetical protein